MEVKVADISAHLISSYSNIKDALEKLNSLSGRNMTLFVVDSEGVLAGSLTDGDIRRALTVGADLSTPVNKLCNRKCLRISDDSDRYEVVVQARKRGITLLPVLENGCPVRFEDLRFRKSLLPLDAVLMAGGRGERLRPLTETCPKPLLKVGGIPIIDYNIDLLSSYGIDNIFVTVNYLRNMIEEHFNDGNYQAYPKVKCVAEPCRLGTMGSLSLVEGLEQEDIIVMNSDLLTTIDFEKMFLYHKDSHATLTMAAIPYNISVPYAIVDHREGVVKGLSEKPTYTYLANAGIYMMKREVVDSIEKGAYLDAPDLIERLISRGDKVVTFPIDGTWIDIGNPEDYAAADRLMSTKKRSPNI